MTSSHAARLSHQNVYICSIRKLTCVVFCVQMGMHLNVWKDIKTTLTTLEDDSCMRGVD